MLLNGVLPPEVYDYYEDIGKYQIKNSYDELQFSKGKINYERLCKRLTTLQLPNPKIFLYQNLSIEELKTYIEDILNKIFDNKYSSEINNYCNIIRKYNVENPFDATLEESYAEDSLVPKKIFVSNLLSSIEIVSTSHEFIHALLSKYSLSNYNAHLSNIHYKELLSIIIEYIVCYEISNSFKEDELEIKHKIIRLDHNQQQVSERNDAMRIAHQLHDERFKLYSEYVNHNSYGYIVSDIYANRLLDLYKEDPKTLIDIIANIIDGDKTIKDLIQYYNLSLTDKPTIYGYNDKIEETLSKSLKFTKK